MKKNNLTTVEIILNRLMFRFIPKLRYTVNECNTYTKSTFTWEMMKPFVPC